MARMLAAWYERCGAARDVLRIGEVPRPDPRAGEVLVRIAASGVNPHDTKRRSGWSGEAIAARCIPHSDGAGTIIALGAGVEERRLGERVWLHNAGRGARENEGTAAEFCALPAANAFALPDGVDFATGATLGVPALTAHRAVFADGPVAGQTVLVTGAAGAVGSYATQFALRNGASVIATVSTPEKAAYVASLGAAHILDHRHEDVAERVRELTDGHGVERIVEVDFGANAATCAATLAPNGVIAAYSSSRERKPVLDYYAFARKGARLWFVQGMILPRDAIEQGVRDLTAALLLGRLRHPPPHPFPPERAAEAHEWIEAGGGIGKAMLVFA
jgi:NADPH:quinone reductase